MSAGTRARAAAAVAVGLLMALVGVPAAGADTIDRRAPRVEMIDLMPVAPVGFVVGDPLINDRGVVVVNVLEGNIADGFRSRVFRWHRGTSTELSDLGGGASARSINARGQVAGGVAVDGRGHAVVWQPDGTLVRLDDGNAAFSGAQVINRRGTVLGSAGVDLQSLRPVVWRDGVLLETVPDAQPVFDRDTGRPNADLNDRDVAVLNLLDEAADVFRPVLWDDGIVTELPAVDGPRGAVGLVINNKGQVAGHEILNRSAIPEKIDGIVWDGPDLVELAPGGEFTVTVTGMNERGVVVGYYAQCGECGTQAFVARDGLLTTLPAVQGPEGTSRALAINERGQVVGDSATDIFGGDHVQQHATLWDDGEAIDLGSLGGDSVALGINRRGQIVGFSQDMVVDDPDEGIQHAVLWTVRP
jgi:probable HAF family extracellular repeat protein